MDTGDLFEGVILGDIFWVCAEERQLEAITAIIRHFCIDLYATININNYF